MAHWWRPQHKWIIHLHTKNLQGIWGVSNPAAGTLEDAAPPELPAVSPDQGAQARGKLGWGYTRTQGSPGGADQKDHHTIARTGLDDDDAPLSKSLAIKGSQDPQAGSTRDNTSTLPLQEDPSKRHLAATTTQGCLTARTDNMEPPPTIIDPLQAQTTESHARSAGVTWEITAAAQLVGAAAAQRPAVIAAYSNAVAVGVISAELRWSTAGAAGTHTAAQEHQAVKWRPLRINQTPCRNASASKHHW